MRLPLSRRMLLSGLGISVFAPLAHAEEPVLTDDGLWHQPWFLESFLELPDDLSSAAEEGKRFAIMWELKGCPYCKETHFVNFARPDIREFVKSKFNILQLNLIGSREVTDFDGEKLAERDLAAKYGIRFTPTLQFFPEAVDTAQTQILKREVARAQGYLKPDHFIAMFRFVETKAYEHGSFRDYLKSNS
jgi:thioredoxin-related protein